ncbi:MAG: type II toxin-antitoxin system VapC family toxin [Cocleimonas sp.]
MSEMIGIDTNVLVRYITQDDKQQADKANQFIDDKLSLDNAGIISKIVLCELTWVLSNAYGYSRKDISNVIQQILITQEFVMEDSDLAQQALQSYQNGNAGFADYFLAQTHSEMGAGNTVTFDKKAAKSELFQLL